LTVQLTIGIIKTVDIKSKEKGSGYGHQIDRFLKKLKVKQQI